MFGAHFFCEQWRTIARATRKRPFSDTRLKNGGNTLDVVPRYATPLLGYIVRLLQINHVSLICRSAITYVAKVRTSLKSSNVPHYINVFNKILRYL